MFARLHGIRIQNNKPQWRNIKMQPAQLAAREHERIIMLFNRLYQAAGRPRGATLWMTLADTGGAVDIFISPRSAPLVAELGRYYDAPSSATPRMPLMLVAGHGASKAHGNPHPVRRTTTSRSFVPARFRYRSVDAVERACRRSPWPCIENQTAPFVRRYVKTRAGITPGPH